MNFLIFCTHNGAATVAPMLEALQSSGVPENRWHVIAVDNGSTDQSSGILRQAAESLPMTVLHRANLGKNAALNMALDYLTDQLPHSDLVVFTDDDILPDSHWLATLEKAAADHPNVDLFGGTVTPHWPQQPSEWLLTLEPMFDVLYARTKTDRGPCPAGDIFGPNMAIRSKIFAQGTRFDESIGPAPNRNYRMGSETELLNRLEAEGHQAWFEPAAEVEHQIRPHQMTKKFVFARAKRHGLGKGELAGRQGRGMLALWPFFWRLTLSEIKSLIAKLPPLQHRHSRAIYNRNWLRGYVQGYVSGARS